MIGWIIFGSIVLLILIILWQSVTVTFDYENKLSLTVKFLGFTLYTTEPKPKKAKKPKKPKKEKKKKSDTKPTAEPHNNAETAVENNTSGDADVTATEKPEPQKAKKVKKEKKKFQLDLDMIMDYVRSASPPIKRLFKHIRWYDVYIDWVVATDDAAKTALTYGGVCSILYPFFEWLTTYFTAKVKEIHVEADFSKEESDIFAYFVIKLRLSTALTCILWLGWRVLKTYMAYNNQNANTKPKKTSKGKSKKASNKKGK